MARSKERPEYYLAVLCSTQDMLYIYRKTPETSMAVVATNTTLAEGILYIQLQHYHSYWVWGLRLENKSSDFMGHWWVLICIKSMTLHLVTDDILCHIEYYDTWGQCDRCPTCHMSHYFTVTWSVICQWHFSQPGNNVYLSTIMTRHS